MDTKISIIIPIYILNKNLQKITDECLTSLINNTPNNVELIIVDDGSPIKYNTNIGKLIKLKDNTGYSHAANMGLEASTGDIIILGNNDLIFPENWLSSLLFPLNIGYEVSTVWTSDQKDIKLEDRIEKDAYFGSLFAMTRDVYNKIGGFDEQFRGKFSDTDLRHRMLDEHIKIGKNLSSIVEHMARGTYKEIGNDEDEYLEAQRLYEIKWDYIE